jgi:adenylate kinase
VCACSFVSLCAGKTTTCARIAELSGFTHVEVGSLIRDLKLYDSWNSEFDVSEFDEDKVCDELETRLAGGGMVVDFHTCDFMPERWFQLVLVLRTDNTILYPRLERRGYSEKKITENVDAEIAQVCLDEAQSSWPQQVVIELPSDNADQLESNAQRTIQWLDAYKKQHGITQ